MINLNGPLRSAMVGNYGLAVMMQYGHIKIMSGAQPASADAALTGDILGVITQDGKPFSPGVVEGGLVLGLGAFPGTVGKLGSWVFTAQGSGMAGWWRYCWNSKDTGVTGENVPRIDGAIGEGLLLPNPNILEATTQAVADFTIFLPPYII